MLKYLSLYCFCSVSMFILSMGSGSSCRSSSKLYGRSSGFYWTSYFIYVEREITAALGKMTEGEIVSRDGDLRIYRDDVTVNEADPKSTSSHVTT